MFYVFFGLLFNVIGGNLGNVVKYMMVIYVVFGVIGLVLFFFGVDVVIDKDKGILSLKLVSLMFVSSYFVVWIVIVMLFVLLIILSLFVLGVVFGDVVMIWS